MTLTQMYWLITLPKVAENLGVALILGGLICLFIVGIVSLISFVDSRDEVWEKYRSFFQKVCVGCIASFLVGLGVVTFIPTTKEIVAIYGISYLTQNKDLQQIPPKLFELANIKLSDLIEEVK